MNTQRTEPTRAFIAYDFALIQETALANVLEEAKESQPDTLDLHYAGSADDPKMQGTIWRGLVQEEIQLADRFLAFIDLPNANVGFEIGYAFGCGKPVAVYRFRSFEHNWLKQAPLRGHFKHQLESPEGVHDAILKDGFLTLEEAPSSGDEVIVLCPKTGGGTFLRQINSDWGWKEPPLSEFDIETLPLQFAKTGLVIWIVVPHGEGDKERDGGENASLSILAGYGEAREEIDLKVLVHTGARVVADVEHTAKRFTTNSELKKLLTEIAAEWSATVAARHQSVEVVIPTAPAMVMPRRPPNIPPHPDDPFPDTADAFIGRESLLGLATDTIDGLIERFHSKTSRSGGRGIRLISAHGYGGMGKSWYLHRIRCSAEAEHPKIRSLIVDWDKPEWLAPLTGEPRVPVEIFDLLAIRLVQRIGAEAADPYWLAKARVEDAAAAHKLAMDRFEGQLQAATTNAGERIESHLRQLLSAEKLWHDDEGRRGKNIQTLQADRRRYRNLFGAWCHETGETNPCVICPNRERAEGLREAFRAAMTKHPLIIVLDTCEVLSEDLDGWLRELFIPLFREPVPLLLLMGSRLRPDLHQVKGSRLGWIPESPPAVFRVDDFGELLRFTVSEIETAVGKLHHPVQGDTGELAEVLHRVTLGVPLAVRGLLDLHEDGDPVLQSLSVPGDDEIPLSERDAVRKVIGLVSERFLLNLEGHAEREEDLRDIIALAILPAIDHAALQFFWDGHSPKDRLRALAHRYSLLSDGDLHPSVRYYLRRHWRSEHNRPAVFADVVERLLCHASACLGTLPPTSHRERIASLAAELNLRSWNEGDQVVDDISRTLCLARLYEVDCQLLENLLSELPLTAAAHAMARKLWHRDDEERPATQECIAWLRDQCKSSTAWTEQEKGALDLLDGIACAERRIKPEEALSAFTLLQRGLQQFEPGSLPNSDAIGEAFYDCGIGLHPNIAKSEEWVKMAVAAFEQAASQHCREAECQNIVGNLCVQYLEQFEKAKHAYLQAMKLDPKFAKPHDGLGDLYLYHLSQPENAGQAYRKAIELDPTFAFPHSGLGELYQHHLRQSDNAERAYLKAIELDPEFAHPHNGLGELYQHHLRQPDNAEQAYLKAIELDPKFAHPHSGLGELYQHHLRQPAKAEQAYLKAIELKPKFAHPHTGLGNLYQDHLSQPEKAEQAYLKAIEIDSKYTRSHNGLGNLYQYYLGQPD